MTSLILHLQFIPVRLATEVENVIFCSVFCFLQPSMYMHKYTYIYTTLSTMNLGTSVTSAIAK